VSDTLEHPDLKSHYLPDDFLKRLDAAHALNELGWRANYESLSRLALRREGPPFIRRGRLALYRYADLVAWAKEQIKYYPVRRVAR
jgi:hypothetical protein